MPGMGEGLEILELRACRQQLQQRDARVGRPSRRSAAGSSTRGGHSRGGCTTAGARSADEAGPHARAIRQTAAEKLNLNMNRSHADPDSTHRVRLKFRRV